MTALSKREALVHAFVWIVIPIISALITVAAVITLIMAWQWVTA